jgi:hypothetical protein
MDPVVNTFLPCTYGANKRCAIGNTLSNIEQSLKKKFEQNTALKVHYHPSYIAQGQESRSEFAGRQTAGSPPAGEPK